MYKFPLIKTLDRKIWVFKEHSLLGDKTPEENHSGEGAGVGVDSFVLIIRVCVSWK